MSRNPATVDSSKQMQESGSLGGAQVTQEYVVRIPKAKQKSFNIMRFSNALRVDVTKWTQARMERENNWKEFKAEEDIPKYGAGSEFGREQREESRRKKFGIVVKKYNPDEQPWLLKLNGKNGRKFKGIREGGVTENTSYYVFTQAADGTFEAYPVEEWYNFTPIQCYKALSAEEAEEEFGRRDKVLNFFSIMVKKRLQNENAEDDDEEEKKQKGKKKGKQQKDFKISDMDEWAFDSEGSGSDKDDDEDGDTSGKGNAKKGKKKGKDDKRKKKKDKSDDEAVEESDEGDFDDREVDYMTNSSSGSDDESENEKTVKELKSVADEEALKNLSDEEEEEEKVDENKEAEEAEAKEKLNDSKSKIKQKKENKDSSGESSSETSDSDLDDTKYQSVMFMQEAKRKNGSGNSASSSRANTPTRGHGDNVKEGSKSQKRKLPDSSSHSALKKQKMEGQPGPSLASTLDGITEDAVRRYLARKPMTASELLQKFKSKKTKMSSEQLVTKIAEVLKKIDLVKTNIKGKMYLSLKS